MLTGYGRDALGEQCVLAFTYGQQPTPGHLLIGYLGGLEMTRKQRIKVPVLGAVREAQKLGTGCSSHHRTTGARFAGVCR